MLLPNTLSKSLSLTRYDWQKSIFLTLSALLSFIIANELGIHHAYWASMPVWVVTQPSRELLIGRGFYRLIGTALGGALGFFIVTSPLEPISKFALLSISIALLTALTKVIRGIYSYATLMMAVTVTIVAMPSLINPESAYDLMLSRLQCTFIGVCVVVALTFFLTPKHHEKIQILPKFRKNAVSEYIVQKKFQRLFLNTTIVTLISLLLTYLTVKYGHHHFGELMAFGMVVYAIILGTHENPRQSGFIILRGALIGGIIGILYRIFIFPELHSNEMIYLSLLPFFLIGAIFRVSHLSLRGAIDANMAFLLIGQPGVLEKNPSLFLAHISALSLGAILITTYYYLTHQDQQ